MSEFVVIILNMLFVVPVLCFVVALILIIYTKGRNIANIYSAFSAILAGFYSFYMLSLALGYIKLYPWLFGWAVPIEYLLSPSIYVYVRHFLYNDNTFKKYDLLFAVPMFIQLFEMFPFLISDNQTKLMAYEALMKGKTFVIPNGNSIIPPEGHLVLKFMEHIVLLTVLWFKIFQFNKTLQTINFYKHPSMSKWITINTTILTLLCVLPIIIVLSTNGFSEFIQIYSIVLPLSVFLTVSSFLLKPWVLYDLPSYYSIVEQKSTEVSKEHLPHPDDLIEEIASDEELGTFIIDEQKLLEYEKTVYQTLEQNKFYLKPGYSSGDLAKDCNIPKHHLSYLLNRKLDIRFNDFINKFRIDYAREFMNNEEASRLTIDAIAVNAGFSSRSTFIKYFQKYTGENPSEYLKANKQVYGI